MATAKWFEESIVKWLAISEHGFELVPRNFSYFDQIIVARKWEQFCKPLGARVLPVVREFYANTYKHTQFKSRVCGKELAFDKMTINKYYNFPDLKKHKDLQHLCSNPDLD